MTESREIETRARRSRLTSEQVAEIRRRYAREDIGYKRLARDYGVSRTTIRSVVRWQTHVR